MEHTQYDLSKLGAELGTDSIIQCTNGNNLDLAINDNVFRLYFQIFNGITLNNDSAEFLDEMTILRELGCSIVQGAKGNLNWSQGCKYNKAKYVIWQVWNKNKLITSSCKERTKTDFQLGGTFTLTTGKWASHIIQTGNDALGRWSWATLQGKRNRKITFIM
eukprot:7092460-Ditylum_brightwellii.AAC.1